MRLLSLALAAALTPAFVALPTVSFASPDPARPVAPKVATTPIGGVAATELPASPTPASAAFAGRRLRAADQARPEVLTRKEKRARFTVAGVSWSRAAGMTSRDVHVSVRVKEDTGWSVWETLTVPDDGPDAATAEAAAARVGTAPLVTGGATAIQVRVDTATGTTPADLKVTTIDPGSSPADDDVAARPPAGSAYAAARTPSIITRAQWGADERLRKPATLNRTVKAITIHHTAGTNSYTQATAAAQVRGIYAYDTRGLGWSDIAYNFLVDKWGRVYEGRAGSITQAVRGAHSMGFNVDTMGVAALGNYETASAPAAMVDALGKVAGWKLSQYGVNPAAKTTLISQGGTGAKYAAGKAAYLDTVHMHQNTSYTLCPGRYLIPQMGTIRTKATNYARYSSTTAPKPAPVQPKVTGPVAGFDGDGRPDVLGRTPDGRLRLYSGTGTGALKPGRDIGTGWNGYTQLFSPGDFTGDGKADLVARHRDGRLILWPGTGTGSYHPGRAIGNGWQMFNTIFSPGDFTGDRKADLLARRPDGRLYLYTGNGRGGFAAPGRVIGSGWQGFNALLSAGDVNSDGKADVIARRPTGQLVWYAGNGRGGWASGARTVGTGWQMFNTVLSAGDFNGDRKGDVLARTPGGRLYFYAGDGRGRLQPGKVIGAGWQMFDTVIGVR